MPLTDAAIRTSKPREKAYKLFDGRGLYLEVAPSGGRWWRLKYRVAGKEKRLSLGVYPEVGLKEARNRCDQMRRLVADGVDPAVQRRAFKQHQMLASSSCFEQVAREWFAKFSPGWASSHSVRIIRRLERDVFPWIGTLDVGEISAPDLLAVLRRIEGRGAVETAHRALTNCSQVFRYAIATGRLERDPAADLRGALPPMKVQNFAATTDPTRLAEILRAMDGYRGSLVVRAALKLMPLLFVRPGELRTAKWADIDLEAAEWRYLVTKTQTPHIVPLCKQAVSVLKDLQPLTGRGMYVFPGRGPDKPMSDNAVLSAMRRLDIGKDEMTGHGFRAVARTLLDEVLGERPDFIEHQLAHAVRDPNGRAYNRTVHLEERRRMMQRWADYLEALKGQSPQGL
ncbi:MAG: integrase arm-type DNA-binding domain-containing protein [Pseudomonadales bacterium]|nr:integrase arm-type DNA-binding domain-containing protein [Pseudomonadales bacterium]